MSGIAGVMTVSGEAPPADLLQAMAAALAPRGPDGTVLYRSGDVGMIETRLALGDSGAGVGVLAEPGGAVLVADAAITNDIELRATLGDAVFATASDGEGALHLYRRDRLDFARHLRGMYAVALHDPAARRLVLARDPLGIKPLYYAETPRGLAFASTPTALLRAGLVTAELVRQARNELLQLQFTTGRETIFAGISRVLPGETVVVTRGRIVERRRIEALAAPAGAPADEGAALAALDRLLAESVLLHRRADAACGAFLSGDVASVAVLAMMMRLGWGKVPAFTIGFSHAGQAEDAEAARAVARSLGAEPVEVEFRESDFWFLLPQIAAAMDDPAADYAVVASYKLAAKAREAGIRVILSGEGADELFAGHGRYRSVMRPWWAGGKGLRGRGNLDRLGILRGELSFWRDGIAAAELHAAQPGRTRLQVAQATDCADWLPNDVLNRLDRCLMAHGVEGRAPFLDPSVAALGFGLADELKLRQGMGKWLLRRWVAEHVPAAQAFARRRGLAVPVGEWIARRGAQLGILVAAQAGVREICLPGTVEKLFLDPRGRHESFAAWTLLFYALWHRCHIEGLAPAADVFTTLGTRG